MKWGKNFYCDRIFTSARWHSKKVGNVLIAEILREVELVLSNIEGNKTATLVCLPKQFLVDCLICMCVNVQVCRYHGVNQLSKSPQKSPPEFLIPQGKHF